MEITKSTLGYSRFYFAEFHEAGWGSQTDACNELPHRIFTLGPIPPLRGHLNMGESVWGLLQWGLLASSRGESGVLMVLQCAG